MRKRISDTEANQLVAGMTPEGQPDFGDLARAIGEVRTTANAATAPAPSGPLLALLEGQASAPISTTSDVAVTSPPIKGVRRMFEWISGIGLASKIAIGTGIVLATATGVGAAGALPGPAQSAFDTIVSTVTGDDSGLDDDPAPYVDDESDVDDDPATVVEDESDVNDDPATVVEDESDVDDDNSPSVEDESDVDDDPASVVEDQSDSHDDGSSSVDDESDADDDVAPSVEDESDVED